MDEQIAALREAVSAGVLDVEAPQDPETDREAPK